MVARQKNTIDDKHWPEVWAINNYAVFLGHLLMGVRGLGLLVLTWTTVVLLGGFVSVLEKKDFWCLTAITLVQTAGVFDFLLKEKASDVGSSLMGLLTAVALAVQRPFKDTDDDIVDFTNIPKMCASEVLRVLAFVLWVVQALVLGIVLCPLVVLYVLGVYLSAGISLWRLIQHDYDNADGDTNLKPALDVLYSLVVAQGVVYGYRTIYDSAARTQVVRLVADAYSLETDLVVDYMEETMAGCRKDPSFARGRNLVTYAVDQLMESKSRYGYISGVIILGVGGITDDNQPNLMKELLAGSASFSHVVQRLVATFGPTSPYSTEIKVGAAKIVEAVAGSIRLDQFPQGMIIECISTLLDTFEEYTWRPEGYNKSRFGRTLTREYERDWLLDDDEWLYSDEVPIPRGTPAESKMTQGSDSDKPLLQGYKDLVVRGLFILQKLAINEYNCRVMSNTDGLLAKTMAHLISEELHRDHHGVWSSIAEKSLEFMKRLMATLGGTETTKLMTSEISRNSQATIFRTLECHKCDMLLKRKAAQVLVHLSPADQPSIVPGGSGSILFLWILLDIFLLPDYHFVRWIYGATHLLERSSYTTKLAGEKMQAMISSKMEPNMLPSVVGNVIGTLTRTVAGAENNAYRIHAAAILKHLCEHYTKDDEYLKELKKATANVMPEVLKEIAHCLTTEEQVVTEANNGGNILVAEEGLDLEQGGVPHGNGQESRSISHQQKGEQHQGIQLQEALLDLCLEIYSKRIDVEQEFNEMAAKICSGEGMPHKTFIELVLEARYKLRKEEKRDSRLAAVGTS